MGTCELLCGVPLRGASSFPDCFLYILPLGRHFTRKIHKQKQLSNQREVLLILAKDTLADLDDLDVCNNGRKLDNVIHLMLSAATNILLYNIYKKQNDNLV